MTPPVDVDPLLVRLFTGQNVGQRQRRIRLQTVASRHLNLEIEAAECDLSFVNSRILPVVNDRFPNRRIVIAELADDAPPGDHRGTLILHTNVAGAESISLPVEVRMLTGGASEGHRQLNVQPEGKQP